MWRLGVRDRREEGFGTSCDRLDGFLLPRRVHLEARSAFLRTSAELKVFMEHFSGVWCRLGSAHSSLCHSSLSGRMKRPAHSFPPKKHSTFTNTSFLEAQLSFIGHSLTHNMHKQPFLFKILESVLIATTCVIAQATKQMRGNDFSVQITAET